MEKYGGRYLNSDIKDTNSPVKLNKEIYDAKDENSKDEFPFYCPDDKPYICNIGSKNMGLCVKQVGDCDADRDESPIPPIYDSKGTNENDGSKYGYHADNITDYCGHVKQVVHLKCEDYDNKENIKLINGYNLKVMTYNIWGLLKKKQKLPQFITSLEMMVRRMKRIGEIIKEEDPDIICLQEVNPEALAIFRANLPDLPDGNKYHEFISNLFPNNTVLDYSDIRGRTLETYILSKTKPKNVYQYLVSGNLGYPNDMMIAEYEDIVIVNCYLQAGSKHSPGQESKWFHYSRCRMEELHAIFELLKEKFANKKITIMGDFNFNITPDRSQHSNWPENIIIKRSGFTDAWNELHPDDPGLTEDTSVNNMRFNTKFLEKQFRYDGIFYRSPKDGDMKAKTIKMIGTESINVSNGFDYRFKKYLSDPSREDELRGVDDDGKINIHPSDHFGLCAEFTI